MIIIVDYGMGNIRSVYNKFRKMGVDCIVSSDAEKIKNAEKIVLPGVGHFKKGMENLIELNLIEVLNRKILEEKTPIFGICLGTQLFCNHSEEGDVQGLGWIDAEVVKFKISDKLRFKVPNIGWNSVTIKKSTSISNGIDQNDFFYFVHSYHLVSNNPDNIWMTSKYEQEFVSAVHIDNIYGTQFHPEKSHDVGNKMLKQFAEL